MFNFVLAQNDGGETAAMIGGLVTLFICFVFFLVIVAGMWKTFVKAGQPGWACIIPIYNVVVMLEIAGKPIWWIILLFIPVANFIVAILISIALAKAFGKGELFGLGLAFLGPIFYPILGFGDAKYIGPRS